MALLIQIKALRQSYQDDGFSLLETLFALAIMSLASLALFQSTSAMLRLSDRAIQAGERTLDGTLNRLALTNLIDAILPAWLEDKTGKFVGRKTYLTGLSSDALSAQSYKPTLFRLSLKSQGATGGQTVLVYEIAGNTRQEDSFDLDEWIIMADLPSETQFSYLGVDHKWYEKWPPEPLPRTGYFNDHLFDVREPLPEAVMLHAGEYTIWIGRIGRYRNLPDRLEVGRDVL